MSKLVLWSLILSALVTARLRGCVDVFCSGKTSSGVYTINTGSGTVATTCHFSGGGAWTLIGQMHGRFQVPHKWLRQSVNVANLKSMTVERGTYACLNATALASRLNYVRLSNNDFSKWVQWKLPADRVEGSFWNHAVGQSKIYAAAQAKSEVVSVTSNFAATRKCYQNKYGIMALQQHGGSYPAVTRNWQGNTAGGDTCMAVGVQTGSADGFSQNGNGFDAPKSNTDWPNAAYAVSPDVSVWLGEPTAYCPTTTKSPDTPPSKPSVLKSNSTSHAYNAAAQDYYKKLAAHEAKKRDHYLALYNQATAEANAKIAEYKTDVQDADAAKLNFTARQAEANVYNKLYLSHKEKHEKAVLALNHSSKAYESWRQMGIANAHWMFNDIMAKYAIGASEVANYQAKAKQYKDKYNKYKVLYETHFKKHKSYTSLMLPAAVVAQDAEVAHKRVGQQHTPVLSATVLRSTLRETHHLLVWVGLAAVLFMGAVLYFCRQKSEYTTQFSAVHVAGYGTTQ